MASGDAALIGAVITASVAVVVAIIMQIWTSLRARTDRQYVARRAGLVEAQDAMLALRAALAEYGQGLRPNREQLTDRQLLPATPADELEAGKRTATGRFQACVSRVHDETVASAMSIWRSAAERSFISVEEVSAHVEDEWFSYVQAMCRAALMSNTGISKARDRAGVTAPLPPTGD